MPFLEMPFGDVSIVWVFETFKQTKEGMTIEGNGWCTSTTAFLRKPFVSGFPAMSVCDYLGNQSNLARSCLIWSADKFWLASLPKRLLPIWYEIGRPIATIYLTWVGNKPDDGAEEHRRGNNNKDGCRWCSTVVWFCYRDSIKQTL